MTLGEWEETFPQANLCRPSTTCLSLVQRNRSKRATSKVRVFRGTSDNGTCRKEQFSHLLGWKYAHNFHANPLLVCHGGAWKSRRRAWARLAWFISQLWWLCPLRVRHSIIFLSGHKIYTHSLHGPRRVCVCECGWRQGQQRLLWIFK